MKMLNTLKLNIEERKGHKKRIMEGGFAVMPNRILKWLFGENSMIYILRPDETVDTVEFIRHKTNTQKDDVRKEDNDD